MAAEKKNTKKIGDLGEAIACKHLKNKGFSIIERNYRKKWGEIDIVAHLPVETVAQASRTFQVLKNGEVSHGTSPKVYFVEVKSVSYETKSMLEWSVTHETWHPEELVHSFKLNQIRKTIESWVAEHNWLGNVQVDVVAVRMVPREKYASVKHITNVIIE